MQQRTVKNKILEGFESCGWGIINGSHRGAWTEALAPLMEYLGKEEKRYLDKIKELEKGNGNE